MLEKFKKMMATISNWMSDLCRSCRCMYIMCLFFWVMSILSFLYCIFWMRCGGSKFHSGSLASSWTDSVSSLSSTNIVKSEYCCVVNRFLQFVTSVVVGVGAISSVTVDAVVDGNFSPVTWSMQLFIISL